MKYNLEYKTDIKIEWLLWDKIISQWITSFTTLHSLKSLFKLLFVLYKEYFWKIHHVFMQRVFNNKCWKMALWTTNLSQHQTGNSWTSQSNTVKWFIETLQTVHLYSELISLSYKMAFITINVNLESSHHEYFSRLISKFLTLLLRIFECPLNLKACLKSTSCYVFLRPTFRSCIII